MLLPKLRKLVVPCIEYDSWGWGVPVPENPANARSSVKYLELGPQTKPNTAIEELLRWPGALEIFRYDLGVYIGTPWRPVFPLLSHMLAPLTNSLVELHLSGYHNDDLHLENIDYSIFKKLKILDVTQALLFSTVFRDDGHETTEPEPRNGLYKRLPRSLENLNVRCRIRCRRN